MYFGNNWVKIGVFITLLCFCPQIMAGKKGKGDVIVISMSKSRCKAKHQFVPIHVPFHYPVQVTKAMDYPPHHHHHDHPSSHQNQHHTWSASNQMGHQVKSQAPAYTSSRNPAAYQRPYEPTHDYHHQMQPDRGYAHEESHHRDYSSGGHKNEYTHQSGHIGPRYDFEDSDRERDGGSSGHYDYGRSDHYDDNEVGDSREYPDEVTSNRYNHNDHYDHNEVDINRGAESFPGLRRWSIEHEPWGQKRDRAMSTIYDYFP